MSTVTYPTSVSIVETDGTKINILTQLYQIGLYIAFYVVGDSIPSQSNQTPQAFSRSIKKDIKAAEERGAKVKVGFPKTVTDKSGFWEEVVEDLPKLDNIAVECVFTNGKEIREFKAIFTGKGFNVKAHINGKEVLSEENMLPHKYAEIIGITLKMEKKRVSKIDIKDSKTFVRTDKIWKEIPNG